MEKVDGIYMRQEHWKYALNVSRLIDQDDMDDLDHVLNYLREEYSYRIWALVGHSRGTRPTIAKIDLDRC